MLLFIQRIMFNMIETKNNKINNEKKRGNLNAKNQEQIGDLIEIYFFQTKKKLQMYSNSY